MSPETPVPRTEEAPLTPKEEAYECLKNWIIFSELRPGTPLNERELAERFGISRTPLREILQRLSYQRLIIIRPRVGIFVAPIDFFIIKDIFEARLPLERTAAILAAKRAATGDAERLAGLVSRMRQARKEERFQDLIQLDRTFHDTMAEIAGNAVLAEMLEDLHNICLRFWYLSEEAKDKRYEGIEELSQVARAIAEGDASTAARVHTTHVLSFLTMFDPATADMLSRLLDTA